MPKSKFDFIGVWQFRDEDYSDGMQINNMLLILNPDSTAVYRRCAVSWHESRSEGGYVKKFYRKSISFPDAVVTKLDENIIEIEQGIWNLFYYDLELKIDKPPYNYQGRVWMVIDKVALKKLDDEVIEKSIYWECPEPEDEE